MTDSQEMVVITCIILTIFFYGTHWIVVKLWNETTNDVPSPFFTPMDLYRGTSYNIVGCYILWIITFIFAPLCAIGGIFRWLMIIGKHKHK